MLDPRPAPTTLPIQTEQLILRLFRPEDFDALLSYQSRPEVAQHLYWDARSAEEVRESLELKLRATAMAAQDDVLALAMELRATGELVGDIILHLISESHRTGEIGFIVHPDHQGRGYTTEAGHELLRIAFEDVGLHRVIGRVEVRNVASARVLEKLGMRREAHLVENEFVKGEWQSELVYAILDHEWRATSGSRQPQ